MEAATGLEIKAIKGIAEEIGVRLQQELMADHTTIGIGGPALVAYPRTVDQVSQLLAEFASEGIAWRVIGNGSNLIVSDAPLRTVIVSLRDMEKVARFEGNELVVSANYYMPHLVRKAMERSLAGLEELGGVPGCVGGMVRMNAGAYGKEIKDVVKSVTVVNAQDGLRLLGPQELDFGYRRSAIKADDIVVQARLLLHEDDPRQIARRVKLDRQERKRSQPLNEKSAGCVFKNPTDASGQLLSAGKIIEDLGLKGKRIGGAVVSEKHCNFIVNRYGATSDDVFRLMDLIKETVERHMKLKLEEEVEVWR